MRIDVPIDIIHGEPVADPFRWLEERDTPETRAWLLVQEQRIHDYYETTDGMEWIRNRVRHHLAREVVDQFVRAGDFLFYRLRSAAAEQASIYAQGLDGQERMLVDAPKHDPFVSVGIHGVSDDGSVLAYEKAWGGRGRRSIHFLRTATGEELPEHLPEGFARGFAFDGHGNGYFYCHDAESEADHTVRFHCFGSTGEDAICFSFRKRGNNRLALLSDAHWIGAVCMPESDCDHAPTEVWVARGIDPTQWTLRLRSPSKISNLLLHDGWLYAIIDVSTTERTLFAFSGSSSGPQRIGDAANIRQMTTVQSGLLITFLDATSYSVRIWRPRHQTFETLREFAHGTVRLLPLRRNASPSVFVTFDSHAEAPVVYEVDGTTGCIEPLRPHGTHSIVDCKVYRMKYPSKDGTKIPIEIVMGSASEQPRPCIMTAYGGFDVAMTPQFSVLVSIMVELGAVFALPHLRGGAELGSAWSAAGRGRRRQKTFDDFLAAAEWLQEAKVTTPSRLAIFGGSNAGLLVGVAMTQRPDLFRAVVSIAPLLDMVRHEILGPDKRWQDEYGSIRNQEDFQALIRYSPYHHVEDWTSLPATLFVCGDQDERCNPAHVRKTAARMQRHCRGQASILVEHTKERGHSPNLPLSVRVESLARRIAFLCRELGVSVPSGSAR